MNSNIYLSTSQQAQHRSLSEEDFKAYATLAFIPLFTPELSVVTYLNMIFELQRSVIQVM